MTRRIPDPPPKLKRRDELDLVTQVRQYSLISPLFGGGALLRAPDKVTVVRASEIRGQLRFWWRAIRGGQFGDTIAEMRQHEGDIWGLAARFQDDNSNQGGPSKIQISIVDWTEGIADVPYLIEGTRQDPRAKSRPGTAAPEYAAFPLQPKRADQIPGMPIAPVYNGVKFTVQLTYPSTLGAELEAALWAWETFGGLGARTRRGFGALRLETINTQPNTDMPQATEKQCRQWLQRKLKHYVQQSNWPADLPHLSPQIRYVLLEGSKSDPLDGWHELIDRLKQFRQRRRDKNTGNTSAYGHSDWPEPNAIRDAFAQPRRGPHARRVLNNYPRAYFGLPIIFHMPHDPAIQSATLEGARKGFTRYASPLILKPIACAEQQAISLALILEGTRPPDTLTLHGDLGTTNQINTQLTVAEAGKISPLQQQPDVLQAFLDSLNKE